MFSRRYPSDPCPFPRRAGIPAKAFEAVAHNVPVVISRAANVGLHAGWVDGFAEATDDAHFAELVAALLTDDALYASLQVSGDCLGRTA